MTFDKMTIEELTSNLQDYMFTNNNLSRLTKHIIQPILIPKPKQTPNFKQLTSNNQLSYNKVIQKPVLPKKETNSFDYQQLLLSEEQDKLSSYLGFLNDLSQFQKQIDLKKVQYPSKIRQELAEVLETNYKERKLPKAKAGIELLKKPTTFTVTTGHQLCLFTGPSYFVYKILHTIKLARKLKETYPLMTLFRCIGWLLRTTMWKKSAPFIFLTTAFSGKKS